MSAVVIGLAVFGGLVLAGLALTIAVYVVMAVAAGNMMQ